jgi:hypothetical protein
MKKKWRATAALAALALPLTFTPASATVGNEDFICGNVECNGGGFHGWMCFETDDFDAAVQFYCRHDWDNAPHEPF